MVERRLAQEAISRLATAGLKQRFRVQGFRVQGFRGLGFRGLGFRVSAQMRAQIAILQSQLQDVSLQHQVSGWRFDFPHRVQDIPENEVAQEQLQEAPISPFDSAWTLDP